RGTMIALPDSYYIASGLCVLLHVVALANWRKAWALPFGTVTATISMWYLIEPFYVPDLFATFEVAHVQTAYDAVSIFCVALIVRAPAMARQVQPRPAAANLSTAYIPVDRIVLLVAVLWLVLLVFGIWRMDGDVIGALFPIGARAEYKFMWGRAA